MRRSIALLILTTISISTTSCDRKARMQAEERAKAAETRLTQMDAISATKDSLVKEMMATTTFINQINDQLSRVKRTRGKSVTYGERVMPAAEFKANMLARLDSLVTRLDDAEAKVAASEARLKRLAGRDRAMAARIAALDSLVVQYKEITEQQRVQIAQLTTQVDSLTLSNAKLAQEKTQLTYEKASLTTQVNDLTTFANMVYYVVGTKKELLARNVAVERGGSRFLGIGWKTGKSLVPAPNLEEANLVKIDKTVDQEIKFPKADRKYAIVSPQNTAYVEPQPAKDGSFRGGFRVTNPDAFWSASKYLIIVER